MSGVCIRAQIKDVHNSSRLSLLTNRSICLKGLNKMLCLELLISCVDPHVVYVIPHVMHVIPMWCACDAHVMYMWYWQDVHVILSRCMRFTRCLCDTHTDIHGRSQTSYTAPCNGIILHGAQIGGFSGFCRWHTQKQTQSKCVHDLRIPCDLLRMFIFTVRPQ